MPTAADLSSIPAVEADQEFHAHMTAWRTADRSPRPKRSIAAAPPERGDVPKPEQGPEAPAPQPDAQTMADLKNRIQALEQAISELNKNLQQPLTVQSVPPSVPLAPPFCERRSVMDSRFSPVEFLRASRSR